MRTWATLGCVLTTVAIFQDGVANNVTASFQVILPAGSPVHNITFGFGVPGIIGYTDLDDQYGEGSCSLDSQSPGCDTALRLSHRSVLQAPTPAPQRPHPHRVPATVVPHPLGPRR